MDRPFQTLPPTYAPSLVFTHGDREVNQTFCTLFDDLQHRRSVPEMHGMNCMGSYFGWMILGGYYSRKCYLFHPVLLTKLHLPNLPHASYVDGIIMSPPTDPNCVIVFFSADKRSLIFCCIGDSSWIEQPFLCNEEIIEGQYQSVVSCKGKLYLDCDSGLAVIEFHDAYASVEVYEDKYVDKSVPEIYARFYHHVESCGDIYKVALLCVGHSASIIRTLDVYKLDFSSMDWIMVESIGDQIFLLNTDSVSFSATEFGVKGNCIYFLLDEFSGFYRFDMDDGTIKSSLPFPEEISKWEDQFWVIPNCKTRVNRNTPEISASFEGEQNEERGCKDFLPELYELIFSFVSGPDVIPFRLACNNWISLRQSPIRSNSVLSKFDSQDFPSLMTFPRFNKGIATFHHPIYSDSYRMTLPQLSGTIIREAKHGWLLMSRGYLSTFFFNPLTGETINLPDFKDYYGLSGFSFSSTPTSSDCVALGIEKYPYKNYLTMLVYRKRDADWSVESYSLDNEEPNVFVPSQNCNPVFYNGKFYCLGKDGKLGCFDPKETEELQWTVLPVPPVYVRSDLTDNESSDLSDDESSDLTDDESSSTKSFLVEYEGEILSVFVNHVRGYPIQVYKLDWSEMKWIGVEYLGDKVIFLSPTRSIMMPAGLKGIENRIYFPKLNGEDNMFYSLSTGEYHCFGTDANTAGWMNKCEYWNCTWFQVDKEKAQRTQSQPETQ